MNLLKSQRKARHRRATQMFAYGFVPEVFTTSEETPSAIGRSFGIPKNLRRSFSRHVRRVRRVMREL